MRHALLSLLLVVGLVGVVAAEEEGAPEIKRGFVDGKYVDDYFAIVYTADDLKEGFGFGLGGPTVLWSGKCAGDVDVELICMETPREMTAAEWMTAVKRAWEQDGKERKEVEEGQEPRPWITYVQESLAGFQRHHGWAFYPRGYQCFQVHAQVREKSDTSGEAIRKALMGLEVKEKAEAFLLSHLVAKQGNKSPLDPEVVLQAGMMYLNDQFKNPMLSLRALEQAKAGATEDTYDADQRWLLTHGIGLAQLTLGLREEAIPTWKEAIELAAKTSDPPPQTSNSWYNLACAYSLLGRLDEAFDALGKSYAAGSGEQLAGLKQHGLEDPDLENMRKDPRWKELYGEGGDGDEDEDDGDDDEDDDDME